MCPVPLKNQKNQINIFATATPYVQQWKYTPKFKIHANNNEQMSQ